MEIHINRDGAEFGPYSLDDVNAYLADGTLLASDSAWHEGLAEWTTLDQIEGAILPEGHEHAAEEYAEPEPEEAPAPKKGKAAKPVAVAASGGSKKTLIIVLASVFVVLGGSAAVVFLVPIGGQTLWAKMTGKGGDSASPTASKTTGPMGGTPASASGGSINFATQIKPILEKSCYECHNAEKKKGSFRLDDPALALKGGESGLPAIVPGKSAESRLIKLVAREDPDSPMPPSADKALTRDQVALLKQWIDQGAKFQ